MATDDSADEIRGRMAELRRDLAFDIHEVSRNARVMTDWRFFARRFPWVVFGVAAVAGYMLIPKRKEVKVISPDPNALAEMFRKEQLKLETPASKKESRSMAKSLLLMGITAAAKFGANYMGEQLRTAAMNRPREHAGSTTPVAAPPPPPRAPSWPK
jgi:hypothetical protein